MNCSNVTDYITEIFSKTEIDEKVCQVFKKDKIPIELVADRPIKKKIMYIYGLNSTNKQMKIYHPKYTELAMNAITLDGVFQNYLEKSFI